MLYLVSPDYALRAGRAPYEFTLDVERDRGERLQRVLLLGGCASPEDTYRTVGTSRAVALATTAPTLASARASGSSRAPARCRCSSGAATSATSATGGPGALVDRLAAPSPGWRPAAR